MGIQDNEKHSESIITKNTIKTEQADVENDINEIATTDGVEINGNNSSSAIVLETIMRTVHAEEEKWPNEMFEAIQIRNGRMPRYGWEKAYKYFCEKFNSTISFKKFFKRAKVKAEDKKEQEAVTKVLPTSENIGDENTNIVDQKETGDSKLEVEIAKAFMHEMNELKKIEINDFQRTRKIYSQKIKWQVLEIVLKIARKFTNSNPPKNLSDIARTIQCVQATYENFTKGIEKQSKWKDSINKKIEKFEQVNELITQALNLKKLPNKEIEVIKTIMKSLSLTYGNNPDMEEAKSIIEEKRLVYQKKLEMAEKRRIFRRENQKFELFRGRFYRNLKDEKTPEFEAKIEDIGEFWNKMWCKNENESRNDYSEYLDEFAKEKIQDDKTFISQQEFTDIIKRTSPWKAAGPDGLYNFFIKKCDFLHESLYNIALKYCTEDHIIEEWLFKGITYLIPKPNSKQPGDFRPITCMSNIYKIITKSVSLVIQYETIKRELISGNQLGCIRKTHGAKEQAMINNIIYKEYKNNLKTSWIDVKKAFDSISHEYLIMCLKKLNLPQWIVPFIKRIIGSWEITIKLENESILNKKIEKGILQGDSLSPLLFIICMDPLSRKLNEKYPTIEIKANDAYHTCNHLLYIDDLKLFAENDLNLVLMVDETISFLSKIGLEINKEKSASNTRICEDFTEVIGTNDTYKYLGIHETEKCEISSNNLTRIINEITGRAEALCKTKLNSKNLISAINEFASSVINYYIGIIPFEPNDLKLLDKKIRRVLMNYKVHYKPACKERLYLPRSELGRGLSNIEHRCESILYNLYNSFNESINFCTRRAAIMESNRLNKTHLGTIKEYLSVKYKSEIINNKKMLLDLQKTELYNKIQTKYHHRKLYNIKENEHVDIKRSSLWLKKGNVKPQDESAYFLLQDRNMFGNSNEKCPHCNIAKKTVEHLSTKCEKMLGFNYTHRHNEIVRCIHLFLCQKYGILRKKKIRTHSVQEIVANENVEIRVDTRIRTDVLIKNNRPDIFVRDKRNNEILLIEVGVTNQDLLTSVESEKVRKYELLANEISLIYKKKVRIIPYVLTWEGIVTNFHRNHNKLLGIPKNIEAYIQSIVLKKTMECVSAGRRYGEHRETNELPKSKPSVSNPLVMHDI